MAAGGAGCPEISMPQEFSAMPGSQIYDYSMYGYFAAYLVYAVHTLFYRTRALGWLATGLLAASWVAHTVFFVLRALFYHEQHGGFLLPATNMYEAVSYFAWIIVLLYLIAEQVLKTRAFALFALVLPIAGVAYATKAMDPAPRELFPSLKSYWLAFHVSAMFISYSVLFLSFVFALMYILRARGVKAISWLDPRFDLRYLDSTSYRLAMLGFPVLTLGIFLGAVWADSAWGRYWGWDPKETWALITWLIYLGYLHFRSRPGWAGYRSALMNTVGFVAVLITFQGVNLISSVLNKESIHAYAEGGSTTMLIILGCMLLVPMIMFFMPGPREDLGPDIEELPERIDAPRPAAPAPLASSTPEPPGGPSAEGQALKPNAPAHKPDGDSA
jgi:cytochrome c-type biogenesis protein CcsB